MIYQRKRRGADRPSAISSFCRLVSTRIESSSSRAMSAPSFHSSLNTSSCFAVCCCRASVSCCCCCALMWCIESLDEKERRMGSAINQAHLERASQSVNDFRRVGRQVGLLLLRVRSCSASSRVRGGWTRRQGRARRQRSSRRRS